MFKSAGRVDAKLLISGSIISLTSIKYSSNSDADERGAESGLSGERGKGECEALSVGPAIGLTLDCTDGFDSE